MAYFLCETILIVSAWRCGVYVIIESSAKNQTHLETTMPFKISWILQ